ncbi:MAG: type II toxin-antitoxin system HicB family antitoxin [Parcubacteria group bacterium]|nr:type II toxin-antitoxin system HicB family antitoxin [Parcubacteria group bacterium]
MLDKFLSFFRSPKSPQELRAKYHIPETVDLDIQITPDGWFVITSKQLPGMVTQGKDGKEVLDMLNDAILTYYDVPLHEGKMIMNQLTVEGHGIFQHGSTKALQTA